MTPVNQTIFVDHSIPLDQQRGNCLTAVVASLLDLPIDAVPNFVQQDVLGGPDWWTHLFYYLKIMKQDLRTVSPRNPPSGYYAVAGLSSRSTEERPIHHVVIYKDGRMVHDPHPDGTGILTETFSWHLAPLD